MDWLDNTIKLDLNWTYFEPEIIKKRETTLADNLQDKIIRLYGLGMSFRDISEHRTREVIIEMGRKIPGGH